MINAVTMHVTDVNHFKIMNIIIAMHAALMAYTCDGCACPRGGHE